MTRTPRRRQRRSIAKLARRFWILAVVLVAFLAWCTSRIVALPAFKATTIVVTGLQRGSHVPASDVLARAAVDPQSNVWLLDRASIERRVDAIAYVASTHVSVRPPAAVIIDVRERAIDGCVRDDASQVVTIDAERRVLNDGCDTTSAPLYVVRDRITSRVGDYLRTPELIALQADRKALDPAGDSYRSYARDLYGELEATLSNGIVVKFGDDDQLDQKQRLVGPILAQVGSQGRPVVAVDIRAIATPVVQYRPESVAPKPAHPHPVNKL